MFACLARSPASLKEMGPPNNGPPRYPVVRLVRFRLADVVTRYPSQCRPENDVAASLSADILFIRASVTDHHSPKVCQFIRPVVRWSPHRLRVSFSSCLFLFLFSPPSRFFFSLS